MITRRQFITSVVAGVGGGLALTPGPALPAARRLVPGPGASGCTTPTANAELLLRDVLTDVIVVVSRGIECPERQLHKEFPANPITRRVDWPLPDRRQMAIAAGRGKISATDTVTRSVFAHVVWHHVRARVPFHIYAPQSWELVLGLVARPPLTPRKILSGQVDYDEWCLCVRRAGELGEAEGEPKILQADERTGMLPGAHATVHLGMGHRFYRMAVRPGKRFVAVLDEASAVSMPWSVARYGAVGGDPVQVVPWGQLGLQNVH